MAKFVYCLFCMKLALSGGFGNLLFQINLYFLHKGLFQGFLVDTRSLAIYRKLRKVSSYDASVYIKQLSLEKLILGTHGLRNNINFTYSKFLHKPFLGHLWSEKFPWEFLSRTNLFRSYAQVDFPVALEFSELITTTFILPRLHLRQMAKSFDAVVHVRGGDFRLASRLPPQYYIKATSSMKKILVCTNDENFARSVLPANLMLTFSSKYATSELDDFAIMAFSNTLVSSNSTFSWWAGECGYDSNIIEPQNYLMSSPFCPISNVKRHKIIL